MADVFEAPVKALRPVYPIQYSTVRDFENSDKDARPFESSQTDKHKKDFRVSEFLLSFSAAIISQPIRSFLPDSATSFSLQFGTYLHLEFLSRCPSPSVLYGAYKFEFKLTASLGISRLFI